MENVLIFEFHSGKKIIGQYVGTLPAIDDPLPDVFVLKHARIFIGRPAAQGVIDIGFGPPWKTPASVGVPWPGHLLPYKGADIETRYPPDKNILSAYAKDTLGIMLPLGAELPKEMRQ